MVELNITYIIDKFRDCRCHQYLYLDERVTGNSPPADVRLSYPVSVNVAEGFHSFSSLCLLGSEVASLCRPHALLSLLDDGDGALSWI